MKVKGLLAAGAALVLCSTALAAAYTTGEYTQGAQSGFEASGIDIVIGQGSLDIKRVLMAETCNEIGGSYVKHDFFGFQSGPGTTWSGKISASGNLSANRNASGSQFMLHGHITGSTLTVSVTARTPHLPIGGRVLSCIASGSFSPTNV